MSTNPKMRSAYLKIDRAKKHVDELNKLLSERRPFLYILETDTSANQRATYAKRDEAVIEEASVIVADALQNLRSALDHAYWQVVSPIADARSEKAVQFPFSQTADRLEEAVKNRLAHKVSPEFLNFILRLKPHGERGGNDLLYLLHDQNGVDKHRTLIPVGDYKSLNSDMMRKQVPDFPPGFSNVSVGQSHRDIVWPLYPNVRSTLGLPGLPLGRIIERQLNVPVEITFTAWGENHPRALVPTLQELVETVRDITDQMGKFA